jgi:hypothetical protein
LAHWKRLDLWVQCAWELLRTIFWFNPLVHLAAHAVRTDQELACDQSILGDCGDRDRYHHGQALLAGAGVARGFRTTPSFGFGQKERIAMVTRHRKSPTRSLVGLALCGALGAFALTEAPEVVAQEDAVIENDDQATQQTADAAAASQSWIDGVSGVVLARVQSSRGITATTSSTTQGADIRGRADNTGLVATLLRDLDRASLRARLGLVQRTRSENPVEFHIRVSRPAADPAN